MATPPGREDPRCHKKKPAVRVGGIGQGKGGASRVGKHDEVSIASQERQEGYLTSFLLGGSTFSGTRGGWQETRLGGSGPGRIHPDQERRDPATRDASRDLIMASHR
jgi:hypothetical protein